MKGQLIAFEGSHCAGKGTQIKGLDALTREYDLPFHACIDTFLPFEQRPLEPLERLFERKYLHKVKEIKQTLIDNNVEERIADGQTVVIDRYIQSLYAIYSFYGVQKAKILSDMKIFIPPTLIINLQIPPEETQTRAFMRNKNVRAHKLNNNYNRYLNKAFLEIADEKTIHIEGIDSKADIHRKIREIIWPNLQFEDSYIPDLLYRHKHTVRPL